MCGSRQIGDEVIGFYATGSKSSRELKWWQVMSFQVKATSSAYQLEFALEKIIVVP
jgi:hypothetical protein